jgi:uridylate kinase
MAIYAIKAIASLGVVSALAVGGSAVTQKAIAPPTPTHAIKGIVKSISRFYLAIVTGSGKKAREVTLALSPDTERDGEITIGATVSIRYRMEGRTLVATAVSAHADKQRHAAQIPRQ